MGVSGLFLAMNNGFVDIDNQGLFFIAFGPRETNFAVLNFHERKRLKIGQRPDNFQRDVQVLVSLFALTRHSFSHFLQIVGLDFGNVRHRCGH